MLNKTFKIIIPLPNNDYDPSEVAIPWKLLSENGFDVFFSTPNGEVATTDSMMLSGEGLDFWGWIPLLKKIKLIGLLLRANSDARKAHQALLQDKNFQNPCCYADLKNNHYDGLILPGGHAKGIKPYLEDLTLQNFVANFFETLDENKQHKPISAVCHGVLVAPRSISPTTKKSVLFGKKTTALTWALESSAWSLTKYFARFWDANYYRTYIEKPNEPKGYWGVEQEIKRSLKSADDFLDVPKSINHYKFKTSGIIRDKINNSKAAWIVQDGHYISARWPGDIHTMTLAFIALFNNKE